MRWGGGDEDYKAVVRLHPDIQDGGQVLVKFPLDQRRDVEHGEHLVIVERDWGEPGPE